MPEIPFRPEQFGPHLGSTFSLPGRVVCGWDEIVRAAITVGRRNWPDVIQHGTYSILEMLWRVAMVRANLVEDLGGRLRPSQAFTNLDRSEKGAVSYFLGLCFSKLLADRLFEVPWLLHLDVYRQQLNPMFALPMRPDFVGVDTNGDWLVLESKGRSWQLPSGLMDTAKRQTRSLRRIGGALPALRVAVGCCFRSAGLSARIRDPDEVDQQAVDLPLDQEALAREYYRPLVEFVNATAHEMAKRGEAPVLEAALPGMDASVQIDVDVLEWYQGRRPWKDIASTRPTSKYGILRRLVREAAGEGEAERPSPDISDRAKLVRPQVEPSDGVTVQLGLSWREELMRREPGDRAG